MRPLPSVSDRLRTFFQGRKKSSRRSRRGRRLEIESLEQRVLLSVGNTYVDDNFTGQSNGTTVYFPGDPNPHTMGTDAFATITDGKNNTTAGGNVYVAAGTYTEQVILTQDVNIFGAGQGSTIIQNPGSLATNSATGQTAIIDVGNAATVSITDLTVSGPGFSYADLRYGIYVGGNADLEVSDVTISHIRDATFSGVQSGCGIRVGANFASDIATATISGLTISDYQKCGIVVDGAVSGVGSYATITGCTITGAGPTGLIAQNGIQISRGAAATITGNSVSDNYYTGLDTGTGILFFESDPADSVLSSNTFSGNQHDFIDSVTSVTLVSSLNPAPSGDPTFTATVGQRTPSSPAPSSLPGTVQFYIDGVATGSPQTLDANNQATLTVTTLSVGDHTITAEYSGSDLLEAEPSSASMTQKIFIPPPKITNCPTCPPSPDVVNTPAAAQGSAPSGNSSEPVRYFDGVVSISMPDLSSFGFGTPWGQDRTWTNGPGYATQGVNGNGVMASEMPYLMGLDEDLNSIVEISNGTTARYFDLVGSDYQGNFFDPTTLVHNTSTHEYVMSDASGDQIRFYDFSAIYSDQQKGSFKSFTDPAGNVISVTAHTADGKIAEVQRSAVVNSDTITESYLYTYVGSGPNSGLLESVTLRRQVNAGSWQTVRSMDYAYYDGVEANGNKGDLKTAILRDANGAAIDTSYYRYYVANGPDGYKGGLKFVFGPASFARLQSAVGDPFTATNSQVSPYADQFLEYDSAHRVKLETVQGAGCSSCSGGQGTYTFAYTLSINSDDYNSWHTKTIETLPDGNENIVYTNGFGEIMLSVYHDTTTDQKWDTFYKYDGTGKVLLQANPSAVTGYDDTFADLLNNQGGNYQYLSNSTGLITTYSYYTDDTGTETTSGGAAGYTQSISIRQGETGTAVPQSTLQYFTRTEGGSTTHPIATQTVYRNDNGTGAETTSFTYTWFSGTTRVQSMTTSLPVVSTGQNGPGSADVSTTVFNSNGRPIWMKDADGFLTYMSYDEATDALVKMIRDVDTTLTSDFTDLPTGWSTPAGGGLHLVSTMQVDSRGRDVQQVDPNGNVTYTVYDDANHEVRVYAGWNSSTGMPTGPTQVFIDDRDDGFTESFTMAATPHLTAGVPDGTEAISDIQTLERDYVNAAGQVSAVDRYFDLTGLTYTTAVMGTLNVNFYQTQYGYDDRGRLDRTETPTGTIYRTVYDGLSRAISMWVGTNDTPASGEWESDNNTGTSNMIQVSANVYDNGGVGDSNLTETTQLPGLSQASRVTDYFYDWRNRLVATKSGMQTTEDSTTFRPITFTTYDNLDEAVLVQMFNGDGVTISTVDGEPQAPSASLRWAQTAYSYDDQGRLFQQQTFSVTPGAGTVSPDALTTNYYFDHRGNQIAVSAPGGLWTKDVYDGAGRLVTEYMTDGSSGTTWADASTVADDIVLEQMETVYDGDSNAIETITRQRFDDATGTGALGTPTSGIAARVYYSASYFDAADRDIADVNVGTNGGTAWTRSSTVPARSDTVLVTSYEYDDAGWLQDTIDPRGIDTRTLSDALYRTTETIQNYMGNSETATSDVATLYTYDGDNHVLTITAVQPTGTPSQTTAYVYGATTAGGSAINSNDLLGGTQYPDPTTGSPSSTEKETYTYNALGGRITGTDRNGSTHEYSYDVLGRLTSDAVTTLATGVDGAIRRIEYAYDEQGNAYLATSYDSATGGSIVNQVLRTFNGLGQLTKEYRSTAGAVNTSTTPNVQYAYTEISGGQNNSRLTSITYPSGYVLSYNYGSSASLNDRISRLASLSDNSGTLEGYTYLGLGTVVERDHAESGVNLTYISQTSSTGDAGDKYTGLDRFGRVVEQNWYNTSTTSSVEDLTISYDRDSNVTVRTNLLNSDFTETYSHDLLNQLAEFARANGQNQVWTVDALGNFTSVDTDSVTTTNTFNAQNQQLTNGSASLTYDTNGNLTTDETGRQFVYDAWNRLVEVRDSSSATLATYSYDALGRKATITQGSSVTSLYYSAQWQVLEESVDGTPTFRYVWSPVYVDAMVLRDQLNGDGSLNERLYAVQDANWNVTALADTGGSVVERFVNSSYGVVTVYDASWNQQTGSSFAWSYLFKGGRFDAASGLYDFRNRVYSPTLARWLQQDPLRFQARDENFYRFVANDPEMLVDPMGLFVGAPAAAAATAGGAAGGVAVAPVAGTVILGGGALLAGGAIGYGLGTVTTGPLTERITDWWWPRRLPPPPRIPPKVGPRKEPKEEPKPKKEDKKVDCERIDVEPKERRRKRDKLWYHGTDSTETVSTAGLDIREIERRGRDNDAVDVDGFFVTSSLAEAVIYAEWKTNARIEQGLIPPDSYPVVLVARDSVIGRFLVPVRGGSPTERMIPRESFPLVPRFAFTRMPLP